MSTGMPAETRPPTLVHPGGYPVVQVDLGRIREHPRNIRSRLTRIDELARSIRVNGVLVPLVAHQRWRRAPGKQDLELIFGHRRLAAACVACLVKVPVRILPAMSERDILLLMLAEHDREPHDRSGVARGVAALRDEHGMTDRDIAAALGSSLAQVQAWRDGNVAGPQSGPEAAPVRSSPAAPARPKRTGLASQRIPKVSVARLHTLLVEHDDGRLPPAVLVSRIRGIVGGWEPDPTRAGR